MDPVKAQHVFFDKRAKPQTRMVSLSPSATAVTQSISNLATLKPKVGKSRLRNIIPQGENLNAVAIHFSFGDFSAILGSDLEEKGNLSTGWSAVFNDNMMANLSLARSKLFKVPHHGSKNSDHTKIWSDLLINRPISITTPYTRSGLPFDSDIARITSYSECFIVTRGNKTGKKIRRNRMVERELKSIVKEKKVINDKMGHIQIRIYNKADLSIATNDCCVSY